MIGSDWSREFEEPIIIPPRGSRGKSRELVTLKDAGEFIAKLQRQSTPRLNGKPCTYSITSSARARTVAGASIFNAFIVLRLSSCAATKSELLRQNLAAGFHREWNNQKADTECD